MMPRKDSAIVQEVMVSAPASATTMARMIAAMAVAPVRRCNIGHQRKCCESCEDQNEVSHGVWPFPQIQAQTNQSPTSRCEIRVVS
jgi:hypothetical protein